MLVVQLLVAPLLVIPPADTLEMVSVAPEGEVGDEGFAATLRGRYSTSCSKDR